MHHTYQMEGDIMNNKNEELREKTRLGQEVFKEILKDDILKLEKILDRFKRYDLISEFGCHSNAYNVALCHKDAETIDINLEGSGFSFYVWFEDANENEVMLDEVNVKSFENNEYIKLIQCETGMCTNDSFSTEDIDAAIQWFRDNFKSMPRVKKNCR